MNIFLLPSNYPSERQHLQTSVLNSINRDIVEAHLNQSDVDKIYNTAGGFFAWGVLPGNANKFSWEKMQVGDAIINYSDNLISRYAFIVFKVQNQNLARAIWGDLRGNTFEYMYFFTKPYTISPPVAFSGLRKYGFIHSGGLPKVQQNMILEIEKDFGTVRNFLQQSFGGDTPIPEPTDVHNKQVTDSELTMFTAIKTKPFVILAGLSGSGKSREVRSLAYKFCTDNLKSPDNGKPGNFELIKVKPNWHDSSDLLGYESRISGTDKFIITDFVSFIVKAWKNTETPFFLCLDEMNLAPVEQYFAEYLSVIETRRNDDAGNIITDSLISNNIFRKYDNDEFWERLEIINNESGNAQKDRFRKDGLCLPPNLIIIGTVNMDETTHSFSRKVLDRAMTIEMNVINLESGLEEAGKAWAYPSKPYESDYVSGNNLNMKNVFANLGENGNKVVNYLINVNSALIDSPFAIAYRIRDEFIIYVNYFLEKGGDLSNALDNMTLMKILPRIEGDFEKTNKVLNKLDEMKELESFAGTKSKLNEMKVKLEKYQFTSYWN